MGPVRPWLRPGSLGSVVGPRVRQHVSPKPGSVLLSVQQRRGGVVVRRGKSWERGHCVFFLHPAWSVTLLKGLCSLPSEWVACVISEVKQGKIIFIAVHCGEIGV